MAIYTIKVVNNSRFPKRYTAFTLPPPAVGGVHTAWASFENVPVGGSDSVEYAPSEDAETSPPSFIIAAGDDVTPGQVSDQGSTAATATIDFTDRSETTATVTQDAAGAFTVAYS